MPSDVNRNLLLILTGGIAAYKTPELVRRLRDHNINVRVVMTHGAKSFITPLTMQAVSGNPVHDDLLDPAAEAAMGHIELARWADLVVVAPATASAMATLAHGLANDLFSTLCLATEAPVAICPAMNQQMWAAAPTQRNLQILRDDGKLLWGPAAGSQACGETGEGRMLEPAEILQTILDHFSGNSAGDSHPKPLARRKVLITAGPTREAIDPVRYLTNHSSGKMGFALAQAALNAGAEVTVVAGPCSVPTPPGVHRIDVESAADMLSAVKQRLTGTDVFIGCAAVADFRPAAVAEQKMKKQSGKDSMQIELVKNPDILAWVAEQNPRPFTVGFAAETNNVAEYAKSKLQRKKIDLIIANDVSDKSVGFNSDNNAATAWWPESSDLGSETFDVTSKQKLAQQIIELISSKI